MRASPHVLTDTYLSATFFFWPFLFHPSNSLPLDIIPAFLEWIITVRFSSFPNHTTPDPSNNTLLSNTVSHLLFLACSATILSARHPLWSRCASPQTGILWHCPSPPLAFLLCRSLSVILCTFHITILYLNFLFFLLYILFPSCNLASIFNLFLHIFFPFFFSYPHLTYLYLVPDLDELALI